MIAVALFAAYQAFQRRLKRIVPDNRATVSLTLRGVSNLAQSSQVRDAPLH
jgi:hypothetical protein